MATLTLTMGTCVDENSSIRSTSGSPSGGQFSRGRGRNNSDSRALAIGPSRRSVKSATVAVVHKSASPTRRKSSIRHFERRRSMEHSRRSPTDSLRIKSDEKRSGAKGELRSHEFLNRERLLRNLAPFTRTSALDKIAQAHAIRLAREQIVVHSVGSAAELHVKLEAQTSVAENVQCGTSVSEIHEMTMTQVGSSSYNNILGQFEEVGIGKARGKDGLLYMCQVFRTK